MVPFEPIIGVGTGLGGGQVCTNRKITGISAPNEGKATITVEEDGNPFSTAENNVVYSVAQETGGCDDLNGASGMALKYYDGVTPVTAEDNGKVSISYRGLEDLWGNVWELLTSHILRWGLAVDECRRQ